MAAKRLLAQQLRFLVQRSAPWSPPKLPHLAQASESAPAMQRASQNVSRIGSVADGLAASWDDFVSTDR